MITIVQVRLDFYYVSSRYYDPEVCRFINADNVVANVGSLQGYNLFQYCLNNPANMADETGQWPKWIDKAIKTVAGIKTQYKALIRYRQPLKK